MTRDGSGVRRDAREPRRACVGRSSRKFGIGRRLAVSPWTYTTTTEEVFFPRNLLVLIYVGVGLVVAATHHYFSNVHGWRGVVSAVLAVILWPLILLGINLHIRK
jgi:hypothetical protein